MNIEEKLQHFYTICMDDVQEKSCHAFSEYSSSLEKTLENHKAEATHAARMQVQGEKETIQRKMNKELAIGQINLKRKLSSRHEELKEKLFIEVKDMLDNYMETPEYTLLLDRQIKQAKEFAGQEDVIIYLDPADQDKLQQLILQNDMAIKTSKYSFGGGTRAVIPSRNILIDNSFDTKLSEAKQSFRLPLGGISHD